MMKMSSHASFSPQDIEFMSLALDEAAAACEHNDVPVGAVIIENATKRVLASCHNTREKEGSAIGHAEISAIKTACDVLGTWRLSECTLYVTLEPCPMCAGAILAARLPLVICGAKDAVGGAMGSVWSLHAHPIQNSHTTIKYGCMEEASKKLLQTFFKKQRAPQK